MGPFNLHRGPSIAEQPSLRMSSDRSGLEVKGPMPILGIRSWVREGLGPEGKNEFGGNSPSS